MNLTPDDGVPDSGEKSADASHNGARARLDPAKNREEPEGQDCTACDEGSWKVSLGSCDVTGDALDSIVIPSLQDSIAIPSFHDSPSSSQTDFSEPPSLPKPNLDMTPTPSSSRSLTPTPVYKAVSTSAITVTSLPVSNPDLPRSVSCFNLGNRFVHVESRVKRYIRDMKQRQAEHRARSPGRSGDLSSDWSHQPEVTRRHHAPWFFPYESSEEDSTVEKDSEALKCEIKNEKRLNRQKDQVLSELEKSHQELLLKYAAAENTIDKLRLLTMFPASKPVSESRSESTKSPAKESSTSDTLTDSERESDSSAQHPAVPVKSKSTRAMSQTCENSDTPTKSESKSDSSRRRRSQARSIDGQTMLQSSVGLTCNIDRDGAIDVLKEFESRPNPTLEKSRRSTSAQTSFQRNSVGVACDTLDLKPNQVSSAGVQTGFQSNEPGDYSAQSLNAMTHPVTELTTNQAMKVVEENLARSLHKWQEEVETRLKKVISRSRRRKDSPSPSHVTISYSDDTPCNSTSSSTWSKSQPGKIHNPSKTSNEPIYPGISSSSTSKHHCAKDCCSRHSSQHDDLNPKSASSSVQTTNDAEGKSNPEPDLDRLIASMQLAESVAAAMKSRSETMLHQLRRMTQ